MDSSLFACNNAIHKCLKSPDVSPLTSFSRLCPVNTTMNEINWETLIIKKNVINCTYYISECVSGLFFL